MKTMDKICIHWNAGQYTPNADDIEHYHFMIGYDPKKSKSFFQAGKFEPEDNLDCKDGKYAQHCGGGNTGAIGFAVCCHLDYHGPANMGKFPLTQKQVELLCLEVARQCHKYNIPIDRQHVYTHYEFGINHPDTTSAGKIDINYLPSQPHLKPIQIGDYLRAKVEWYLNNKF